MVKLFGRLKTIHHFINICKSNPLFPTKIQKRLIFLFICLHFLLLRLLGSRSIDFFDLEISRVIRVFELIVQL